MFFYFFSCFGPEARNPSSSRRAGSQSEKPLRFPLAFANPIRTASNRAPPDLCLPRCVFRDCSCTEWPASRHRIASVFASWERIGDSQRIFAARTRIARIFASHDDHRIAISVLSTHHRSHRIAARIARYGPLSSCIW